MGKKTSLAVLVENDCTNQRNIEQILSNAGIDVITAFDGLSGLDLSIEEHPDLLIISSDMVAFDVVDFCNMFRKYEKRDVPIFVITNGKEVNYKGLEAAGVIGSLKKPVEEAALLDALKDYIEENSKDIVEECENIQPEIKAAESLSEDFSGEEKNDNNDNNIDIGVLLGWNSAETAVSASTTSEPAEDEDIEETENFGENLAYKEDRLEISEEITKDDCIQKEENIYTLSDTSEEDDDNYSIKRENFWGVTEENTEENEEESDTVSEVIEADDVEPEKETSEFKIENSEKNENDPSISEVLLCNIEPETLVLTETEEVPEKDADSNGCGTSGKTCSCDGNCQENETEVEALKITPTASAVNVDEIVAAAVRQAVEKISAEMIEKIAWEVVPDMAELLVKKEIEKLLKIG